MTPFVIVADVRTGSTLLSTSLDRHPQVRCYGELFHGDDLPDNRPENCDRRAMSAGELRDRLAQYASMLLAEQTGVYHPYDHDPLLRPEQRPTVSIDPQRFRQWVAERDALFAQRRRQLARRPALELDYETLTGAWDATMHGVQEFLRVEPLTLQQGKRKQATRPLAEVIANFAELEST